MVEFAIISFVLTAMLAGFLGLIVLGLGSFQNNIATESAGRELDGNEVFIKANFVTHFSDPESEDYFDANTDELQSLTARQMYRFLTEYKLDDGAVLYDESRLVISPADWRKRDSLNLPAINKSLLGQYIYDPGLDVYRFPGAVVDNTLSGNPTVLIPLLPEVAEEEEDVEEEDVEEPVRGIERTFFVTTSEARSFYPVSDDWVAPLVVGKVEESDDVQFRIIMFHPSQPASLVSIRVDLDANGLPDPDENGFYQFPVEADDVAAEELIGEPPSGYTVPESDSAPLSQGGRFGLGESFAFLQKVRPYRLVFETSSLFRLGSSLNPIVVKYDYDEDGNPGPILADQEAVLITSDTPVSPFVAYEGGNGDQAIELDRLAVDRFSEVLQRYFVDLPIDPAASEDNDFVKYVFRLLPDDGGIWRVSVAVEFETDGAEWALDHVLQLMLYKNGRRERLIATHNITSGHPEPISMTGNAIIAANEGDVLQVRVLTQLPKSDPPDPNDPEYDVRLSGDADSNWISYERIAD